MHNLVLHDIQSLDENSPMSVRDRTMSKINLLTKLKKDHTHDTDGAFMSTPIKKQDSEVLFTEAYAKE